MFQQAVKGLKLLPLLFSQIEVLYSFATFELLDPLPPPRETIMIAF